MTARPLSITSISSIHNTHEDTPRPHTPLAAFPSLASLLLLSITSILSITAHAQDPNSFSCTYYFERLHAFVPSWWNTVEDPAWATWLKKDPARRTAYNQAFNDCKPEDGAAVLLAFQAEEEAFYQRLDQLMPRWEDLEDQEGFQIWLAKSYTQELDNAFTQLDAQRAAAVYNRFLDKNDFFHDLTTRVPDWRELEAEPAFDTWLTAPRNDRLFAALDRRDAKAAARVYEEYREQTHTSGAERYRARMGISNPLPVPPTTPARAAHDTLPKTTRYATITKPGEAPAEALFWAFLKTMALVVPASILFQIIIHPATRAKLRNAAAMDPIHILRWTIAFPAALLGCTLVFIAVNLINALPISHELGTLGDLFAHGAQGAAFVLIAFKIAPAHHKTAAKIATAIMIGIALWTVELDLYIVLAMATLAGGAYLAYLWCLQNNPHETPPDLSAATGEPASQSKDPSGIGPLSQKDTP